MPPAKATEDDKDKPLQADLAIIVSKVWRRDKQWTQVRRFTCSSSIASIFRPFTCRQESSNQTKTHYEDASTIGLLYLAWTRIASPFATLQWQGPATSEQGSQILQLHLHIVVIHVHALSHQVSCAGLICMSTRNLRVS